MDQVQSDLELYAAGYTLEYPIKKIWDEDEYIDSQVSSSGRTFYRILNKTEEVGD